jgi:hypothetical protein
MALRNAPHGIPLSDDIRSILDDLSPEARAAAERAAAAAGIPLELWLARLIVRTAAPPDGAGALRPSDARAPPERAPYVATGNPRWAGAPSFQLAAIRRYIASVTRTGSPEGGAPPGAVELLERRIARKLGVPCVISDHEGNGTITLHYRSVAERLRLLGRLGISHPAS